MAYCEECRKIKLEDAVCPICRCGVWEGKHGGLGINDISSSVYCWNCMEIISGVCNPNLCKGGRERLLKAGPSGYKAGAVTYPSGFKDGSSNCYIATAVYGSYDCPEVWTLRRFRDNELSSSWLGRCFIRIYYAVSPKIVELFGNKKWFSKLWKPIIDKIVRKLQNGRTS